MTVEPLQLRFQHVGLITPDVDFAMATHRAIGASTLGRLQRSETIDLGTMSASTDVAIEFQGPPLPERSAQYHARQGWSIERVALSCPDVTLAYATLTDAGVPGLWEPTPVLTVSGETTMSAGLTSPDGLIIELVQISLNRSHPSRTSRKNLALHHVCCVTDDLRAAEEFWTGSIGLSKVLDFTAPLPNDPHGRRGFVMLGDPDYDAAEHEFVLEIIGGEHDSIDGPVFEQRGACFDHLCYTVDNVVDTWTHAVSLGVEPLCEPAYYPEYDATIAWLYDADGNHIELMSPLSEEAALEAARTGVCSNQWVDDWQRSPVVLPRRGDQAIAIAR